MLYYDYCPHWVLHIQVLGMEYGIQVRQKIRRLAFHPTEIMDIPCMELSTEVFHLVSKDILSPCFSEAQSTQESYEVIVLHPN